MRPLQLVMRNIGDGAFRSWVLFYCALILAGFATGAILVIRGAENGLHLMLERLGADVMVIPSGNQTVVEHALLMGVPATIWMPRSVLDEIASIPEVEIVSPQLFLSTMRGASCCSVSDMFMIAYDPETDFTVHPWLENNLEGELQVGEAIGGHYVIVPDGRDNILIYGYEIELMGNLEPTGSGLDQSMFFTFDTALDIARLSPMQAERELVIDPDSISAALVRVKESADPHQVALQIEETIPGVDAIENAQLFRNQRERAISLLRSAATLAGIAWILSILLVGLVTSITITGRKREIGVLRALGAPRSTVLGLLLAEGLILAASGAGSGIILACFTVYLFKELIVRQTGLPFQFLQPFPLLVLALVIIVLTLTSVILATLPAILRIANREPGTTMKE